MRTARRSNAQLKITSTIRQEVHDFMRPFHATLMWCLDGPMDTEIDEIMCFVFYRREANAAGMFENCGVVLIQTWVKGDGFTIFPEQGSKSDELVAAYTGKPPEVRIPVEGMTPDGFPEPGPAVGDLDNTIDEYALSNGMSGVFPDGTRFND